VLRLRDSEKARAAMIEHSEHTRQGVLKALLPSGISNVSVWRSQPRNYRSIFRSGASG
jgi:hypothetical protein